MTQSKICVTCGTHYPASVHYDLCPICADDRQYIPEGGQRWTTEAELLSRYSVRTHRLRENVYELEITPAFAIAQRAFLILSPQGNILWDCIPLLTEPMVEFIKAHGGLRAIAFSHPHYYSNMNDWAETFDCPIYIHRSDEQWIFNKGGRVELWKGEEKALWDDMRLVNVGGHFPGSSILHVPHLSPEGTVFCGDTLVIAPNKQHIAVMYSYPNRMPLPRYEVERIRKQMDGIPFDALYSFMRDLNLTGDVKGIFTRSMDRYLQ
ncbi:MAG: MBL fold metallo-hydrolase [Chitinophagaceae bacterium]|nr:MBL fold metallo-hydrolase [Chitinophagaceae bacterium]